MDNQKDNIKWSKKIVKCDACDCYILRGNVCKHEKSIKHIMNCKNKNYNVDIIQNSKMTYMKAVKLYNQDKKQNNKDHVFFIPKKNSKEYNEVINIYTKYI